MIQDGYYCIYCLTPHPKITHSRKKQAGLKQVLIGTIEEDTKITPLLECPYCDRKYQLISTARDTDFNQSVIKSLKLSEPCIDLLKRYQITLDDIILGVRGISRVGWIKDSILDRFKFYKSLEHHFHYVFMKDGEGIFFIDITKNTLGESLGNNLERVLL